MPFEPGAAFAGAVLAVRSCGRPTGSARANAGTGDRSAFPAIRRDTSDASEDDTRRCILPLSKKARCLIRTQVDADVRSFPECNDMGVNFMAQNVV